MKFINKATLILTKTAEIFHWLAAALTVAVGICKAPVPQFLKHILRADAVQLSTYGFEVSTENMMAAPKATTLIIYSIGAALIFVLMALIFRNLYLIIKKSKETTPFQKANVRMFKEIGYFSLGVPVIGLIFSTINRFAVGVDVAETAVSIGGFIIGLVVLCITQYFAKGVELQEDVDGLL
ncbi:MAG: DUF2975 domain-containing protein [Ruminococcaceae bacterium]|nr:DUF2975 domain-containing protein [Oscillospiraceae bacterium]